MIEEESGHCGVDQVQGDSRVLCGLMKGRTTIIVAHHSTAFLDRVDRSYILEDGRLVEVPVEEIRNRERIEAL
jgi:ABC-type multidrug transport system fused ATPase/permease subunit